jgi:hypothetical protein
MDLRVQLAILACVLAALIILPIVWRFWPGNKRESAGKQQGPGIRSQQRTDEVQEVRARDIRVTDIERVLQRAVDDVIGPVR